MSNALERALERWRKRQQQPKFWCPSRKELVLKHPKNSRYRSKIDPEPTWFNTPEDVLMEDHQIGEIDVDSHYNRVNYHKRLERRDNVIRANEARIEAAMAEQVRYEEKEALRLKKNYRSPRQPFYIRDSIWNYETSGYVPKDEFGRELYKRRRIQRPSLDPNRIAYTDGGYRAVGLTPLENKEIEDDLLLEQSLLEYIALEELGNALALSEDDI
jgi:hypothetical protein